MLSYTRFDKPNTVWIYSLAIPIWSMELSFRKSGFQVYIMNIFLFLSEASDNTLIFFQWVNSLHPRPWLAWFISTTQSTARFFFRGFFFHVEFESHIPKKTQKPHSKGPKSHQLKSHNPKNPIQDPTPKPQTTRNKQIWEKSKKNKPGKII